MLKPEKKKGFELGLDGKKVKNKSWRLAHGYPLNRWFFSYSQLVFFDADFADFLEVVDDAFNLNRRSSKIYQQTKFKPCCL